MTGMVRNDAVLGAQGARIGHQLGVVAATA